MILRRGFTLLETIVVLGIVVLLASLSMPALVSAKRKVKQARSNQQLKQIHLAIVVYAEAEGGEGPLGFGLPPALSNLRRAQGLPVGLFRTGGSGYKSLHGNALYTWMPPLPVAYDQLMGAWREHVAVRQHDPILLIDDTFVERPHEVFSKKSAFGIYLSGSLVRRTASAMSLSDYDVWR